ncbi:UNVERIFIED_CONTAM: hypothetical protein Sangu_2222300 [Sesamum angustifolium]|uniref:Uncharacterized protein n=1 Tax=Sesamum angustifolium TaxID=2727405 RepID=A0AAW2LG10_9LAMI
MDDDWDLHAVVRGCAAVTTTTTDTTSTTTANNPFPSFSSTPNFHEDHQDSFDFPGLIDDRNDPFQGLQEIYQEFCLDAPPPANNSSAGVDTATVPSRRPKCFNPIEKLCKYNHHCSR